MFHNCSISENTADQGGGIYLSGGSTAQIFNSLFVLDQARTTGGGLYTTGSTPTCVNNTFCRNVAASGGAIYATNSTTTIVNTICWRDTANGAQELSAGGGSTAITYSDVQGGWTGTGNIDLNPLFKDEVAFHLSWNSPCIDAGSPDPAYNDPSDPARPDSALYPAMGALRSDIGAYGGSGSSPTIPTAVKENRGQEVPHEFRLEQNYPNPFNPTTYIRWQIADSRNVKLVVYDILGREVAVLVNERKMPGNYELQFNASGLASGVYVYRLTTGSFVQSRKMVVVK
jgi:predicted outer membrane repeat protein